MSENRGGERGSTSSLAGRLGGEFGRISPARLGEKSPKGRFAAIVEKACAAARELEDLARAVHCSFGDFPAREYFWQINGFRGLRSYDIARVIGADPTLPEQLVQGLWDEILPHAEGWRSLGIIPPAVAVPAHAALQDRLLGLTGRDPRAA